MHDLTAKLIEQLFTDVSKREEAYRTNVFGCVARKVDDGFDLVLGRMRLNIGRLPMLPPPFEMGEIRAGLYALGQLSIKPRALVDGLLTNGINMPFGRLVAREPEFANATFQPFHDAGALGRLDVLTIPLTDRVSHLQTPEFSWKLRSADTPFDNIMELATAFDMAADARFEVIAHQVMGVDLDRSLVTGRRATIGTRLSLTADTSGARVAYKVYAAPNVVERRAAISGDQMQWNVDEANAIRLGAADIEIPEGGVLQCFASYKGCGQHVAWLRDPRAIPNPRRGACETFDPDLANLQKYLEGGGRDRARDFEAGVASLAWIMGFGVVRLSGSRGRDAPDLLAAAPSGHLALVECTLGTLKSDSKLSNLAARAHQMRTKLQVSGHQHLQVLPMIVTSLSPEEIAADISDAERMGIAVLNRQDLKAALDRTIIMQDPNQLFDEAFRRTMDAKNARLATASAERAPS